MEIIQITELARLKVEPDLDAGCPRGDWDMWTGFVKITGRGDSRLSDVPAVHEDPTGRIAEAFDHVRYGDVLPVYTDLLYRRYAQAEDFVVRWAKIFHGMHVEYDDEHGGFWFVAGPTTAVAIDNADFTSGSPEALAMQAELIKDERESYRQWADGEAVGVTLERAKRYVYMDDDGEIYDTDSTYVWEAEESIWGIYPGDQLVQVAAIEHFILSDDEVKILREGESK